MDAYKPATSDLKVIAAFVAAAYAMSVALSLVVGLTGGFQSRFIGLNRTGFAGGLIQREDGAHGKTKQVSRRVA